MDSYMFSQNHHPPEYAKVGFATERMTKCVTKTWHTAYPFWISSLVISYFTNLIIALLG
jgi:hypothetical protein